MYVNCLPRDKLCEGITVNAFSIKEEELTREKNHRQSLAGVLVSNWLTDQRSKLNAFVVLRKILSVVIKTQAIWVLFWVRPQSSQVTVNQSLRLSFKSLGLVVLDMLISRCGEQPQLQVTSLSVVGSQYLRITDVGCLERAPKKLVFQTNVHLWKYHLVCLFYQSVFIPVKWEWC